MRYNTFVEDNASQSDEFLPKSWFGRSVQERLLLCSGFLLSQEQRSTLFSDDC